MGIATCTIEEVTALSEACTFQTQNLSNVILFGREKKSQGGQIGTSFFKASCILGNSYWQA